MFFQDTGYSAELTSLVFVTGNQNKLKEVREILAAGGTGIHVTSKALDGELEQLRDYVNCHLLTYCAL